MFTNRIFTVAMAWLTAVVLTAFLWWTAVVAQPIEPNHSLDLKLISELTGFQASYTPLNANCIFDEAHQVYLCQPTEPLQRVAGDPVARATALSLLNSTGLLFIPDSANKRVMVFHPQTGDLIDPDFIQLDDAATGTIINAIPGPAPNQILISDQTRDVVHEYDFDGNYLGVFAPAGGVDTSIMDNIRGIALRPNGNLLVTVSAGPNAASIAEFDTDGVYIGNFVANGSGGLESPFDVYERPSTDWLVSEINNDAIYSYDLTTGAYLATLAPINTFPQQILQLENGNVLVGNFSGTQRGVVEFTAGGDLLGVYTIPTIFDFRGVYQLPNGNLLATTSTGVYEMDRSGNLIDTKYTGQSRYIEWVAPPLQFNKTVGLDATCADTNSLAVSPGTSVTYCFAISNNTNITFTRHDLLDSHLGGLLDEFELELAPGGAYVLTQTAVISQTTVNTATWTVYNPGPVDVLTATATATVYVPAIALSTTVGLEPDACATSPSLIVAADTAVTYCYTLTNIDNGTAVIFTHHNLLDSHLGSLLEDFEFELAPGDSYTLLETAVISQTTVNTATWTAYYPVITATATAAVYVPELALSTTVGTEPDTCAATEIITVTLATAVTYCYTLTNIDNGSAVTFTHHDLLDSHLGSLLEDFEFELAPGDSYTLLETAVISQTTVNTATWTAYNPGPAAVITATATAAVYVPTISLSVTVGTEADVCAPSDTILVPIGTIVIYCYTLTNLSDAAFEQHTIIDSSLGFIATFAYDLQPGMTTTFLHAHTASTNIDSTATWLAAASAYIASASDTVAVAVETPAYAVYLPFVIRP